MYFPEVSTVPLNTSQSLKNFSCSREILNTFSISDVAKEQQKDLTYQEENKNARERNNTLRDIGHTEGGENNTRGDKQTNPGIMSTMAIQP